MNTQLKVGKQEVPVTQSYLIQAQDLYDQLDETSNQLKSRKDDRRCRKSGNDGHGTISPVKSVVTVKSNSDDSLTRSSSKEKISKPTNTNAVLLANIRYKEKIRRENPFLIDYDVDKEYEEKTEYLLNKVRIKSGRVIGPTPNYSDLNLRDMSSYVYGNEYGKLFQLVSLKEQKRIILKAITQARKISRRPSIGIRYIDYENTSKCEDNDVKDDEYALQSNNKSVDIKSSKLSLIKHQTPEKNREILKNLSNLFTNRAIYQNSSSSEEDNQKDETKVEESKVIIKHSQKLTVNPNPEYKQAKIHLLSPAENYATEKVSSSKIDLPNSSFWKGEDSPSKHKSVEKTSNIEPKRMRMDKFDGGSVDVTKIYFKKAEKLKQNCFYVHSRVSPALYNKTEHCLPRSKVFNLKIHDGAVNRILWNIRDEYSHLLTTCSMDKSIKVWCTFDPNERKLVQCFSDHSKAVKDVIWSKCGRKLFSCSYDKSVHIYDVEKGQLTNEYKDLGDFITCIEHHPVMPNTFICGSKNCILAFDTRIGSKYVKKFTYKAHFGQTQDVSFREDGKAFFSCNDIVSREMSDRNIMAWDFDSTAVTSNQIYQEPYKCTRLKVWEEKNILLAQSQGNYIACFDLQPPFKMNKRIRFKEHKVNGYSIGMDYVGEYVISGSCDGSVYIYDFFTGKSIKKMNLGDTCICLDVIHHPVLRGLITTGTWNGRLVCWN
ncbi:DgyrCDS7327 [Dimorphilus gyrociliatus]|uniref:DgyrCDS7327 n=1 Tax=Dimorphilus gyrociliatus TaxID=2664684 RepID=A0A7I8VVN7_9ANNE|nr:DgyrCDS7327 [Dimorphilus gyrociliatus]